MKYKIMCRFVGSDKLEDSFCDCETLDSAKHFAKNWKRGMYTHDADAVQDVVVVDSAGNVVFRITGEE